MNTTAEAHKEFNCCIHDEEAGACCEHPVESIGATAEVDCPIVRTAERPNGATAELLQTVPEDATANPEKIDTETTPSEKFITVAEAKQKLDWDETPAYKRTLMKLAYMATERRNNKPRMSATAWGKRKAKLRKEKAARKRNRQG